MHAINYVINVEKRGKNGAAENMENLFSCSIRA